MPRIVCHFCARLVGSLACLAVSGAAADELSLLGGAIQEADTHRRSGTVEFEYSHDLGGPFAVSAAYLNQGHQLNHDRDGVALQLWASAEVLPRCSVAIGIGPFFYSDTTRLDNSVSSVILYNVLEQDAHGLAWLYSAAVRWRIDSRWLAELRVEETRARTSIDTGALTLGLRYQLDSAPSTADIGAFQSSPNELTLLAGEGVVVNNDFKAHGVAATVEYRRMLRPNVEWDVAWIHEGVPEGARRNGVATELWLVRSIVDDRFVLGAGIGPYFIFDFYPDAPNANHADRSQERFAGLVSIGGSYRFDPRWSARLTWHQVIAKEPYDSGLLVFGLGYRY